MMERTLTYISQENGICDILKFSSWTNKSIAPKDHQSVQVNSEISITQINIAKLDPETGVMTDEYSTIALSGFVRQRVKVSFDDQGEADMAITQLFRKI